jgi:predicted NBD/HSP70 family sugar kinase
MRDLSPRGALSPVADQPATMRRRNVAALMRAVLANGPLSRTDIGRLTGLSAGAVTKLTSSLISARLLREAAVPSAAAVLGRPPVPVEIDGGTHAVISLHIGTQFTTVGLVDLGGRLLHRRLFPRKGTRPEEVVEDARTEVDLLLCGAKLRGRVLGIGATIGGWVDTEQGVVMEHVTLGWRGVALRELLERALPYKVWLDSTVRAMALAEGWFGVAKTAPSWAEIFIGNVVGAAICVDHVIQRGPFSAAGDLTHLPIRGARGVETCICGHKNCFQVVGSDMAVLIPARDLGLIRGEIPLRDVIDAARSGNHAAAMLLRTRARYVGQAVALMLELINPHVVVLAGGVAQAPEYLPDLHRSVSHHLNQPIDPGRRILATALGGEKFPISPAALVLSEYYRDPMAFEPLASLRGV